jgi:hypothetical protein
MKNLLRGLILALMSCVLGAGSCAAQTIGGGLRGTIIDQSGAAVAEADVSARNEQTNVTIRISSGSSGIYNYPDLPVGIYTLTVEKAGFQKEIIGGIQIFANQVKDVNVALKVGAISTSIEVTGAAPLVETGTSQLSHDFTGTQVTQLPNADPTGLALQLALLAPGTTGQQAGINGEGGSIGGTRPRMNNFTIDGVDDNRIDINGHTQYVIPESVADFNLLTNQFSAEYGHSAGGQFNTVTKSGTNSWHGGAWEYNNNRNYDAYTNLQKIPVKGVVPPKPRSDFNRFGGQIGGPIIHNKLFAYGAYQQIVQGLATQGVAQAAPTPAGLATMTSIADSAVQDILKQFPVATAQSGTETVTVPGTACAGGCAIPIGIISPLAPQYYNQWDFITNVDARVGKHSLAFHFLYDRNRQPNVNPGTPQAQFTGAIANDARKFLVKDSWIISSRFVNDFHFGYSRLNRSRAVPPTFANFPNAEVDTLGINVGPEGNSPQSATINTYEFVDNMSYVVGKHSLKWGALWLHTIDPNVFLPRSRGEWDYRNLNELVNDLIPTGRNGALRGAGSGFFPGNQNGIGLYLQDDWKVLTRLTLNLGLRYEWNGVPKGDNLQNLNSISNLPGVFTFGTPKGDFNNFGPRIGLAWDPKGDGTWVVRSGFGISYDVTPQNFPLNSQPPQLYTQQDANLTCALPGPPAWCAQPLGSGFLQGGGLLQVNVPCTTQLICRESSANLIPDIVEPKVLTWSVGVEHAIGWNSTLSVQYVGTRSLELPIQARLNTQTGFDAGLRALPTYLGASGVPATVAPGAVTLADWNQFTLNGGKAATPTKCANPSPFIYGVEGFCGAQVTSFPPLGAGTYHGVWVDFSHPLGHGLTLRANYTYSKNMDNSTTELFSSSVNPRRPQDWQHMREEIGRSSLDVPSKLAISWVYNLPGSHGGSAFVRGLTNGWQWQGTWLAYNGTPVTIQNGFDTNGNGDAAGDRPVLNPSAKGNGVSGFDFVCNDGPGGATRPLPSSAQNAKTGLVTGCGSGNNANIVGYAATDPTARYVPAQLGTRSTVGRNSYRSPGMNLWNMGVQKDINIKERVHCIFSLSAYDVFNHRNYSLSQPDVLQAGNGSYINTVNNALSTTYANINSKTGFLNKYQFSGGSRILRLGLELTF